MMSYRLYDRLLQFSDVIGSRDATVHIIIYFKMVCDYLNLCEEGIRMDEREMEVTEFSGRNCMVLF